MTGTVPEGAERQFARFSERRSPREGYWPLPPDGLCLSSFLVLSPAGDPRQVLVGHPNPEAPWDRMGALDPERLRAHAHGWMLPSCHLLYFEDPHDAAVRILREQLEMSNIPLGSVEVHSETYLPRRHPGRGMHWDLQFLYRGEIPGDTVLRSRAWLDLRFLDPTRTPRTDFARSHDEVLELAGYRIGEPRSRPTT
jgi:hypothetical protein